MNLSDGASSLALFAAAAGEPHGSSISPWTGLVLGLFFVFLNGFFVATEFALVKVRPTQIEPYALRGDRRGKLVRHMIGHLDAYLSGCQLGITLASLALGWIGEPAFAWVLEPVFRLFPNVNPELRQTITVSSAFAIITALHIILGELAPKSLAIRRPESTSLWTAFPMYGFYKLTYPAIWLLNFAAIKLLHLFGLRPASEADLGHDEEELRRLVAGSHEQNLPAQKRELLDNVFELSRRMARQIMVPRTDVVYLSTKRPLEENLGIARRSGHTRYPLCEGGLDAVIGQIHIKDIFRAERPIGSLQEVAREIAFVPETLSLDRLLTRMRNERLQLVAVLDEYGGVSGIVTLENVLEEIVGPIQDEFDTERPELVRLPDALLQLSGAMLIVDLEQELGLEISHRDEDTIGGVVLSQLGRPPRVGDRVTVGPLELEVVEVKQNRVRALRGRLAVPTEESPAHQG
jgi:CBS domain containing-hemolysin-like protein